MNLPLMEVITSPCVSLQPVEECKEEPPIDVVGDNDIKQEPDLPEVKFSLTGQAESALDRTDVT